MEKGGGRLLSGRVRKRGRNRDTHRSNADSALAGSYRVQR